MANFFAELKRRHIYRVAAAYAVVAWVLIQLVNNIAPILKLPDWMGVVVLLLLLVGFPIALVFAWIYELNTPESGAGQRASAGPLDWALMAALVAVLAVVSYQQLVPAVGSRSAQQQEASLAAARVASLNPGSGLSVAVLPFENLSGDANQEFFSDGMTEEITAALAKIPDLRVVARGSAAQFKGEKKDLRAVGQALGATHLIAGAVRKAGDRIRVTAQLVKADDGVNVWSNSYDRELTDVFALQEDIATAIAGALRMPLGLKPGAQLVSNRSIDATSYEQFLRAKALLLRGRAAYADAVAILGAALGAQSWVRAGLDKYLAQAYNFAIGVQRNASPEEFEKTRATYEPKIEAAVRRAIELDPDSPDAQMLQGFMQAQARKLAVGEGFLTKALNLDPNNPLALEGYSDMLLGLGRVTEAVVMKQQLHELEPFIPLYDGNLAEALWLDGQTDAAIAILKDNLGRQGSGAGEDLARIYASLGRYAEAAEVLSRYPGNTLRDLAPTAAPLLRSAPAKASTPDTLPVLGSLGFIYLYIGAPEHALDYYEQAARGPLDIAFLWHPSYASLRKTERFKKIVRDAGLVDYWRQRGWPKFCHPTTGDDFECS